MIQDRDTDEYQDEWREFYLDRQCKLRSLGLWFAGLVAAGAIVVVGGRLFREGSRLVFVGIGVVCVLWLISGGKWFRLMWSISSWNCPRCGEMFFHSGGARNPFAGRCMNCKLRRPKQSEVLV